MAFPSVDILTVVCGKVGVLESWASSLFTMGSSVPNVSLTVVDNACDPSFSKIMQDTLAEHNANEAFKEINIINCTAGLPDVIEKARDSENAYKKHKSTADAFNFGFEYCKSDYIFTLDDDVLCPSHILMAFLVSMMKNNRIGCMTGYYFTNPDWSREDSSRMVSVARNLKKDGMCDIDDVWGMGELDITHCGTGCALWRSSVVKDCLPLRVEIPEGTKSYFWGPDICLCNDIKLRGYDIVLDSQMVCTHFDHNGEEVGLGVKKFLEQKRHAEKCFKEITLEEVNEYIQNSLAKLNALSLKALAEVMSTRPSAEELKCDIEGSFWSMFHEEEYFCGKKTSEEREKTIKDFLKYILITEK
tara:strand:- start:59235 stop:60311 length:1077 start_codon:yes stop_codon:yes gene_type:complete